MTVHLHSETEIAQPADAVWEVIADYALDPLWRGGVEAMTPTPSGPVRVGTTTAEIMRFAGRTLRNDGEVVEVDPGRRFRWRTTAGARAWGSRTVEPVGRNRCRVRLDLHVDPRPAERLLLPLTRRLLHSALQDDVERLGTLVTTREGSGATASVSA